MRSLREELENRKLEPRLVETGLVTTATDSVNLMEITSSDWSLLQSISDGEKVEIGPSVHWLKECGLLVIEGDTVTLSQFATAWLSAKSPQ